MDGFLSSTGNPIVTTSGSAGGSGGSILANVGTFTGRGVVRTNGGAGSKSGASYNGGGGGGGRTAIYYNINQFEGSYQSFGGASQINVGGTLSGACTRTMNPQREFSFLTVFTC